MPLSIKRVSAGNGRARAKDAQADEDAKLVAQIFKSSGKAAAVAKARELAAAQPAWALRALFDKALFILIPGNDREARLARNEAVRSGRITDTLAPVGAEDAEKVPADVQALLTEMKAVYKHLNNIEEETPEWKRLNKKADDIYGKLMKLGWEFNEYRMTVHKATDTLVPVGAEDPERAMALKKHEEGLTASQDKRRAKDEEFKVGDPVHLGFGQARGAGFAGVIEKLENGVVHVRAVHETQSIFGNYKKLWKGSVKNLSKANDIMPVGDGYAEVYAAARKREGQTKAEPLGKRDPEVEKELERKSKASDIQGFEIREKLGISESDWAKLSKEEKRAHAQKALGIAKDDIQPVGDTEGSHQSVSVSTKNGGGSNPGAAKARDEDVVEELAARIKKVVKSAKADGTSGMSKANLKQMVSTSGLRFANANHFERSFTEALARAGVGKFAYDAAPMPIKTSNLVPMPAEEDDRERYVADGAYEDLKKEHGDKYSDEVLRAAAKSGREPWSINPKAKDRKKAADSLATLPIEHSGSEPKDHMIRASQYEVQGDRARALDSYRSAASGYRKANDRANEAKARDGITACQTKFAQQYAHPGAGRVKVCDSVDVAMRTAIERTRAGESVTVVGKTVRPARAADGAHAMDYSTLKHYGQSGSQFGSCGSQVMSDVDLTTKPASVSCEKCKRLHPSDKTNDRKDRRA